MNLQCHSEEPSVPINKPVIMLASPHWDQLYGLLKLGYVTAQLLRLKSDSQGWKGNVLL
jgi:hypothetical protein